MTDYLFALYAIYSHSMLFIRIHNSTDINVK